LPQLPPPDVEPGWLERNLAVLAASARYFDEEGLADASDETVRFQRPRQLFATISLERRVLRDEGFMAEVLETYIAAAPGVYGYWPAVVCACLDNKTHRFAGLYGSDGTRTRDLRRDRPVRGSRRLATMAA
jgi:hypothetical protein